MKPTLKILIVEDSPIIRTAYMGVLQQHHYHVDCAADGLLALSMAKNKYDVIIMDIHLPHVNGIDITAKLRQQKDVGAPIIIGVTSDEDVNRHQMCLAAGMNEVLQKTIASPQKILNLLDKYFHYS